MRYYFESEITKEEKLQIKKATTSVDNNIAIYVMNKKCECKFSGISNVSCLFNNSKLILQVSREIIIILQHLPSIIGFIFDRRDKNNQYEICVTIIRPELINVNILPTSAQGYDIDILNNNIIV